MYPIMRLEITLSRSWLQYLECTFANTRLILLSGSVNAPRIRPKYRPLIETGAISPRYNLRSTPLIWCTSRHDALNCILYNIKFLYAAYYGLKRPYLNALGPVVLQWTLCRLSRFGRTSSGKAALNKCKM